ncbi:hypothetical protein K443DRAFT_295660 [Laccaria amethystina LaAM-08-1]|uniref:Uncharacterized protein n=1 Tax=Laccaria amethystina LaAM-08-1 TaxID=1095629 RepID=A0A0C9XEL0_9AGAR|nr:hypothetical protein K443DRAFT_295660 [Laccaria amethystina LaAM-08-1]
MKLDEVFPSLPQSKDFPLQLSNSRLLPNRCLVLSNCARFFLSSSHRHLMACNPHRVQLSSSTCLISFES